MSPSIGIILPRLGFNYDLCSADATRPGGGLGYVRRRIEAKLINWPFSPLRLAS